MGKTFLDEIAIAEQSSAPGTPPPGYQYIYPKTDGKMYAKNSSGVETEITNAAGGPGSGNSLIVTLDFGSTFTDKIQAVVTGLTWVTATSKIVAHVLTPSGVDADEMILLDIKTIISDIVPGVGFTITLYSKAEAKGQYDVACISI